MDMKLEAALLPVADVDLAKAFYQGLAYMDARERGCTQEAASAAARLYMAEVKHVVV